MPNDTTSSLSALASLSVTSPELRQACAWVQTELGPNSIQVHPAWRSFAHACGMRSDGLQHDRVILVGPDIDWALDALLQRQRQAQRGAGEFGIVAPAAVLGSPLSFADPTLQLWQTGYTPVTVHRVRVDTGVGIVEVVAAVARPTPQRAKVVSSEAD